MKKLITFVLSTLMLVCLAGCSKQNAVLNEGKSYQITSVIKSLDIELNAADFKIERGEEFLIESNLKFLSVSENNGVLKVVDTARGNSRYTGAKLTLYIPNDTVFENVEISTGAAKLTAVGLSANYLQLKLGAGDVSFETLNAYSEVEIEGGAGKITVLNGELHDFTLEMGVGELELTASIIGNSELEFGVGEANLTLIGSESDYKVDIDKGLGSITVDGKNVTNFVGSASGRNSLEIEGGVGAINLKFKKE